MIDTSPFNSGLSIYVYDTFISLKASNSSDFVYFSISDRKIGKITLKESLGFSGSSDTHSINHAIAMIDNKKYLSKNSSGIVTFTNISEINVMGTFEFTLYNENDDTDTISVTNGKFND
ncbi:hypothetical protein [Polaribacter glomeratus]|uniref:Uncharacterized protein n=1 Tax=Polaribacter glomeratus TaxID=102 RepID=A0A2S7WGC0_9FLAO|nr:hypothetical protein [Polaribacter glomeratus]PQJ76668.1 hypothetical protein BTO16_12335 [Polaribacter glomeratus]TXD67493.1 hypothetical protein ESX12_02580 [Polaribacter glomeratus]